MKKIYEYFFKVNNGGTIPLSYIILFIAALMTALIVFKN